MPNLFKSIIATTPVIKRGFFALASTVKKLEEKNRELEATSSNLILQQNRNIGVTMECFDTLDKISSQMDAIEKKVGLGAPEDPDFSGLPDRLTRLVEKLSVSAVNDNKKILSGSGMSRK